MEGKRIVSTTAYEGPLSFETVLAEEALPEEVREEGLRLVSAIGRYFRKKLEE